MAAISVPGSKPEMRSHYRGHKMSLWLSLIPQLHRPGADLPHTAPRHHHFQDDNTSYYEGAVRPQTLMELHVPHVTNSEDGGSRKVPTRGNALYGTAAPHPADPPHSPSTECPLNSTATTLSPSDTLLRRLASSNNKSYTVALTVTIAVGCFLLLLNVLIFACIYHQRGSRSQSLKHNLAETGSSSSSDNHNRNLDYDLRAFDTKIFSFKSRSVRVSRESDSKIDLCTLNNRGAPTFGEYTCYDDKKRTSRSSLPDVSVGSAIDAGSVLCIDNQRPDIQRVDEGKQYSLGTTSTFEQRVINNATQVKPLAPLGASAAEASDANEPDLGGASGIGIQCAQPSVTVFTTKLPGIMKKRVQIQEISV